MRCVRSASAMRPGPGEAGGLEERKGGQLHCEERKVITKACGYCMLFPLTSRQADTKLLYCAIGRVLYHSNYLDDLDTLRLPDLTAQLLQLFTCRLTMYFPKSLHHHQHPSTHGTPVAQGQAPRIPVPHPGPHPAGSPALRDLRGLPGQDTL